MANPNSPFNSSNNSNGRFFSKWKAKQLRKQTLQEQAESSQRDEYSASNKNNPREQNVNANRHNADRVGESFPSVQNDISGSSGPFSRFGENGSEQRFSQYGTTDRTSFRRSDRIDRVPVLSGGEPDNPALKLIFQKQTAQDRMRTIVTFLISVFFHILIIFPLIFVLVVETQPKTIEIISQPGEALNVTEPDDVYNDESIEIESEPDVGLDAVTVPKEMDPSVEQPSVMNAEISDPALPIQQFSPDPIPVESMLTQPAAMAGNAFSGRGQNKQAMLAAGGGSEGSERAVANALEWIAKHQLPNGSWSFNLNDCPSCKGKCRNSARIDADLGATAMALLPFLSAGQTPYRGKYRNQIRSGVQFLIEHGTKNQGLYSFLESSGTMYSHGLAAIALCEAYGMLSESERSRWPALRVAAIGSINYIVYAQDPRGGGWRYEPQMPGDTSVVGWQMMALKSMQLSNLTKLNPNVFPKALFFLKKVTGYDNDTRYGYTNSSGGTYATTSVGLLCRLFLDWKPNNPSLLRGADNLLEIGPDFNDPYYVYYATQLLHHIGGDRWQQWNQLVRDPLIEMQCHTGHEAGSWFPDEGNSYCRTGGRLYVTALYCMTLEVYYRYLPIYQGDLKPAVFPID